MSTRRSRYAGLMVLLALVAFLSPGGGQAQKPPPPVLPNPQAPTLNMPAPLGAQRGTTLELNLTGTNLADPTGLWTSFPAKVTIPSDDKNGQDNAKLKVVLEVPADAPLGLHGLRLATTRGISNLRAFCIDELPQVLAVDTNRAKATPQELPVPCVVVGRADAEASDYYKISVKAGQRLSFDVLGRRLGSALDPQLTLLDPKTGRELPGAHSNDAPGCQTDPRLTYTFKEAGDYLIEVRDVTYRGGPDYYYRLRVGDFPCAVAPFPLAARRGSKVKVEFTGPAVDGVAPAEVDVPADPAVDVVYVAPRGAGGLHGWPVALLASDLDELTEQEPNNEPAKANRLNIPCGISARFHQAGDTDHYVFSAKKGQRLRIDVETLELHTPTLVYLVLRDAKGAEVAKTKPDAAPPLDQRLDFTAAADGDYTLEVQHLNYAGGPNECYRLTVAPLGPGFSLTLPLDRWDVPQGGTAAIPVTLAARSDYNGPIELTVVGPEGLSGKAAIKEGQAAGPAPVVSLRLTASPDLPMAPYRVLVRGEGTVNGKPVVEYASVRAAVSQSMAALPYPPRTFTTPVGLAVTEKPPFVLAVKFEDGPTAPGKPAALTVTATRAPGFDEEIALSAVGLPANVTAALKSIPKGQSEAKGQLKTAANAPVGKHLITVSGKAKYKSRDFAVNAPPASLELAAAPFELKAEPSPVALEPGGKAKLKVTAARKGYAGPIDIELRNLPPGVTAAKATIAKDENAAEVELSAADDAAAVEKKDVVVVGTATAMGNQQVTSPNIAVSVGKK